MRLPLLSARIWSEPPRSQFQKLNYVRILHPKFICRTHRREKYGKSTAIYKFEKIKRAKRAALAANPGAEIIDMGVGEPDEMAFPEVVDELCTKKRRKPENRGYADNGDALLKQAAARYMERFAA